MTAPPLVGSVSLASTKKNKKIPFHFQLVPFGFGGRGIPIGPGVTPSPLLLLRGHRHPGPMGCTMLSPTVSLERVLPYA